MMAQSRLLISALVLLLLHHGVEGRLLHSSSSAKGEGFNGGKEGKNSFTPLNSLHKDKQIRSFPPNHDNLFQLLRSGPSRKGPGH